MKEIIIGSRGSKLALWQSEWVKARLEALEPGVPVRIEIFKTTGDVRLDVPLSTIGGQGAFTKELEVALLDRRVDVAVHSLKDLPTVVPAGLSITATPEQERAVEQLLMSAVNKISHPVIHRMRRSYDAGEEREVQAWRDVFGLEEKDGG